jgi:class 3 adenylate cyclase
VPPPGTPSATERRDDASWTSLRRTWPFGIGIHSGLVRVGNAGTQRRIKYGPRGATVNLASRVEGATKRLGVPLPITKQTNLPKR